MGRAAVAVFVKTPGYSPVKTRLAREIGEERARGVYLQLLAIVERRVKGAVGVDGYFAVAEHEAVRDPLWRMLPVVHQGDGGLGIRLAKIYSELLAKYDRVVLIGADCPELSSELIVDAAQRGPEFCVGPAIDGGFYLFAGSVPLPTSLWEAIEYSAATTAGELISALNPYGAVELLPPLTDLDTADDLKRLQSVMDSKSVILGD